MMIPLPGGRTFSSHRQMVSIILEARDKDAQAVEYIEQALENRC